MADFVEEYWHYDNISKKSEKQFINSYLRWAEKKGYHQSEVKAVKIYTMAKEGIPTLSSSTPSTKMLVLEAVRVLREVDNTLKTILTQMKELSISLEEYSVVRAMGGVGEVLAPKLIAEIGDIRRFHSGKALVAYAGIDAPPYQSGQFVGKNRHISKRGSSMLRKFDRHLEYREKWSGRHFWARGYYVATVGNVNEETIIEYIRRQEESDKLEDGLK